MMWSAEVALLVPSCHAGRFFTEGASMFVPASHRPIVSIFCNPVLHGYNGLLSRDLCRKFCPSSPCCDGKHVLLPAYLNVSLFRLGVLAGRCRAVLYVFRYALDIALRLVECHRQVSCGGRCFSTFRSMLLLFCFVVKLETPSRIPVQEVAFYIYMLVRGRLLRCYIYLRIYVYTIIHAYPG